MTSRVTPPSNFRAGLTIAGFLVLAVMAVYGLVIIIRGIHADFASSVEAEIPSMTDTLTEIATQQEREACLKAAPRSPTPYWGQDMMFYCANEAGKLVPVMAPKCHTAFDSLPYLDVRDRITGQMQQRTSAREECEKLLVTIEQVFTEEEDAP